MALNIAIAIGFVVLAVVITLAVYYVVSGDYLWSRQGEDDGRNWSPPR
jgi:hypothetical protein